jgi:hypothetical protein
MTEHSSTSTALLIFGSILTVVIGGVILYALRTKADVSAKVAHGYSSFELHATQRTSKNNEMP